MYPYDDDDMDPYLALYVVLVCATLVALLVVL